MLFFRQTGLSKQFRPRSGSTLFAILSAFLGHYSMVEPHFSNFRMIIAIFSVSKYLGVLLYSVSRRGSI